MNFLAFTGLINFITCIALGLFVLLKGFKSRQNITYFFLNVSVAVFSLGYFLWQITSDLSAVQWFKLLVVGIILINQAYLIFVFTFLNIIKRHKVPLTICFALNLFYIFANYKGWLYQDFLNKFELGIWPIPTNLFVSYLIFWVVQCVYGFIYLFINANKGSTRRRLQIRYFTIAAVVGFLGGATNWPIWFNIYFPPYGNILISLYIAIVAYAIVRHQLMDISVIVKKTIVFAGLFIASYAVFASFAYIGLGVIENFTKNRWIAMLPSVFVVVVMLRPLESFLRNVTDKFLFQKKYDYKTLLKTFADDVLMVLDMNELVNLTVNKLTEIVKLENATILLSSGEDGDFSIVASSGMEDPEYEITSGSGISDLLMTKPDYLLFEDSSDTDNYDNEVRRAMKDLQARLLIPLVHRNQVVGLLTLGKKKSDEEFSQDDIDILLPISRTLSIAIANARLFEQLSEAQAQAAQREKMAVIGTLSAGINHEICNPLGIARGQCEMFLLNLKEGLYDAKDPEELLLKAREIMEKVITETDRATVITRKLSSFAKPAKGNLREGVVVAEELREVISLLEHDLRLDNIEIVEDFGGDVPPIVADKKQLQEIFFNLIRNAAQSIKAEGAIILRTRSDRGRVSVEIEDTGEGISESNLKRIFDPFFTTKDPGKGTGLGLFIVKQIVERNNGRISVASESGKGTVFSVVFGSVKGAGLFAGGEDGGKRKVAVK
ncbi:MAG: GAF domain-containing protein [Candidatus Omnitrophica bacterium]|nr:GAF domain-containing protein [Candidatus Omnitrophota bacterium]